MKKIVDVAKVNQQHCYLEQWTAERLNYADRTHVVLVLPKKNE